MKKKKYLAIFMAMSMATATAPVTALADDATTDVPAAGTTTDGEGENGGEGGSESGSAGESGSESGSTGESGSESGSTGESGSENGGTTTPDETTVVAKIGDAEYETLAAAIAAAEADATITLVADIEVSDAEKGNTQGIITIEKNLTIDGQGHTITAKQTTEASKKASVFNIQNNATVTVKDLTVDGATAKHGFNIFDATDVTLDNVTIQNCNGYAVVSNASTLTVKDITTTDNAWGGINIDNSNSTTNANGSKFTMVSGTLNEDTSLCIENKSNKPVDAVIEGGTFKGQVILQNVQSSESVKLAIKDGTFEGAVKEVNKDADDNVTDATKTNMIEVSGGAFAQTVPNEYLKAAAEGEKALVNVKVGDNEYVVADHISMDKTSTRIRKGYTDTLKATVEANGKTYEVADTVTWTSDKETVATVAGGVVTGVDYGTATITATLGGASETPTEPTEPTEPTTPTEPTEPTTPTTPGESETPTETPATQAEGDTTGSEAVAGDNTTTTTPDALTATCTVTVYKKSSSSSGGGGGSTSTATNKTTISDSKNGAVTASSAKADTGDKVVLTPKADEGYVLDKITVKDKDGKEVALKAEKDGTYSFTMPKGGVTVDTTFKLADGTENTDKPAAEDTKTIVLQIGSTAVIVDNQAIINDVAPVIRNDRTLVPIRVITEALGGQVAWNEAAKEVTLTVNGKEIKMTIGKTLEKYGVAPVIIGDRTFVPVRFVADELGAVTTWDDATKTVTIKAVK